MLHVGTLECWEIRLLAATRLLRSSKLRKVTWLSNCVCKSNFARRYVYSSLLGSVACGLTVMRSRSFSAMVALGRFIHSTKFYLQLDLTLDGTEVYENMKLMCSTHRWKLRMRNRPVMSPSCMYESDVGTRVSIALHVSFCTRLDVYML